MLTVADSAENPLETLDANSDLVPGLVPGFQVWKYPGTLSQTWHEAQMTQIYSNPLKKICVTHLFIMKQ